MPLQGRKASLLSGLWALAVGAVGGHAAAADQGSAPTAALEEITVTAQKREEKLQKVPIVVTALNAKDLEAQAITNTAQLEMVVPELVYNVNGAFAQAFLRGIGSTQTVEGSESPIATYIDGIYVADTFGQIFNLVDIDRVEVLDGPQGTLYGRNAVGGAINLITLQPKSNLEGKISVGYGDYNDWRGSGYISGGVTDTLALGAYIDVEQRQPYFTIVPGRVPGDPEHYQSLSMSVKAVYTPNDWAQFFLSGQYSSEVNPDTFSARQTDPINSAAFVPGAIWQAPFYGHAANLKTYEQGQIFATRLKSVFDLDFAQLVSLTGYRRENNNSFVDYDQSTASLVGFNAPTYSRQLSEELQLLSPSENLIKWVGGLYYFQDNQGMITNYFAGPTTIFIKSELPVRNYAAYGEVTVPITDEFSVTAGARYSYERKALKELETIPAFDLTLVDGSMAKHWETTMWKLGLNYQFDEDILAYFNYSRGVQSGVFSAVNFNPPVNPEKLDSFEIGVKSQFLDHRLQLNVAAFHYDFNNLQVAVNENGTNLLVLENAGGAEMNGIDASFVAAMTPALKINGAVSYLQTTYTSFPDFAGWARSPVPSAAGVNTQIGVDVTGASIIRSPRWSTKLGGTYTWDLNDLGELIANATWEWQDLYYFDSQHLGAQPAHSIVDASLTWNPADRYSVTAWGKNVFCAKYFAFQETTNNGSDIDPAPPATYGITFTYKLQ